MAVIRAWISLFFSILSSRARSTLRILPRIGRIAWVRGSRASTRGAAGRVALDDEQLALVGVAAASSPSACRACRRPTAPSCGGWRCGRSWPRRAPGPRRCAFLTTLLASVGFSSSHSASCSLVAFCDERAHRDVAELGLGLALELRVAQLHRDDRGEALADVLAEEVLVLLLEQVLGPGVLVDDRA